MTSWMPLLLSDRSSLPAPPDLFVNVVLNDTVGCDCPVAAPAGRVTPTNPPATRTVASPTARTRCHIRILHLTSSPVNRYLAGGPPPARASVPGMWPPVLRERMKFSTLLSG